MSRLRDNLIAEKARRAGLSQEIYNEWLKKSEDKLKQRRLD